MASINIESALGMINLRLKAFATDPQNPPQITRDYLYRLKKIAKQNGTSIKTFRDYIEILLTRFRRLEFTEGSISIQSDDQSIISLLKDIESKHAKINKSFIELKNRFKSLLTFEKIIKLLDALWSGKPIIESSNEFKTNKILFIHLLNLNLLEKTKYQSEVAWTIIKNLRDYFDKIFNQYGLFPASIIPSMYFTEEVPKISENKHLLALENIIKRGEEYGVKFLKLLINVSKNYKVLDEFSRSIQIIKKESVSESIIDLINESFSNLIIALVIQSDKSVNNYNEAISLYEKSWYEIPDVTNFAKKLKDFNQKPEKAEEEKLELLRDYLSIFKVVISLLKRYVQWDNLFTLKSLNIWNEDKRLLNNIRQNLESDNFSLAKGKIINILKDKLKDIIYNYSVILYNNKKWRRGLPESVNFRIKQILKNKTSNKGFNEKELIHKLDMKSYFKSISYLNEKTNNKIQFLKEINSLCQVIEQKLNHENPWTSEVNKLIKLADSFYENLFNGDLETPWNSHEIELLENISKVRPINSDKIEGIGFGFPLILDKDLRPINYIKTGINVRFLVCWSHIHKNNLKITVDYRKERILIQKIAFHNI